MQEQFIDNEALQLATDAAAASGFGAYYAGRWCIGSCPAEWQEKGLTKNMVLLEIFPELVALEIWGAQLANKRILLLCDNTGVVQVINNQEGKSPPSNKNSKTDSTQGITT